MPKRVDSTNSNTSNTPDPGYDWKCVRCGYQWRSKRPGMPPPITCARCHSAYWSKPRVRVSKTKGVRKAVKVKNVRTPRTQRTPQTQKVPVPIVGTAYPVDPQYVPHTEPMSSIPDNEIQLGEVYGILPPPPSVLKRMAQAKVGPVQRPGELAYPTEETVQPTKPVSARVIDPDELDPEARARLERLILKGKAAEQAKTEVTENVESTNPSE